MAGIASPLPLAWSNHVLELPHWPPAGFPSLIIRVAPIALMVIALVTYISTRKKLPLPPGPERWPLLGNISNMPREREWLQFTKWRKTYGKVLPTLS